MPMGWERAVISLSLWDNISLPGEPTNRYFTETTLMALILT
jgi:hypothetical protein